jgi:pimeloyl-ACP methyl ester carboxylesterase
MRKSLALAAAAGLAMLGFGPHAKASYLVKEMGNFYIGGQEMRISGQPLVDVSTTAGMPVAKRDPNGEFEMNQMYVEYVKLAHPKAKYPIIFVHGGGLSGTTWENGPDGHPGWIQYFLNAGYNVYEPDAVERGRSSWSQFYKGQPLFRPKREIWELFRIGPDGSYNADPAKRKAYPGTQFPVAYLDNLSKQMIPRWTTNDAATQKDYDLLVDKVCPCIVIVHSQGGNFGYNMLMHNPAKVEMLVLLEPSGAPNPQKDDKAAEAKSPIATVWGDHLDTSKYWPAYQKASANWRAAVQGAGGTFDWIELPKLGITGNTHMMMQDRNSDQVAGVVQKWLKAHGSMK